MEMRSDLGRGQGSSGINTPSVHGGWRSSLLLLFHKAVLLTALCHRRMDAGSHKLC
jgi:hypothetical protein